MIIKPIYPAEFFKVHVVGRAGVRARILAVALIPSVVLLSAGVSTSIYLVNDGKRAERWAQLVGDTTLPLITMTQAAQEERRASLLHLAGDDSAGQKLRQARANVDVAAVTMRVAAHTAATIRTDLTDEINSFLEVRDALVPLRRSIDARSIPLDKAYGAYAIYFDNIVRIASLSPRVAPDAAIAVRLGQANHLLRAAEAITRSQLVAAIALEEEPQVRDLTEFGHLIGEAQGEIAYLSSTMQESHRQRLTELTSSSQWKMVSEVEAHIGDVRTVAKPSALSGYETGTADLPSDLLQLWADESTAAQSDAARQGHELARRSLWGAAGVLSATTAALLAALYLANRFIGRMRRLRQETLETADQRLPETIKRLSDGGEIDAADLAPLHFGADEIGQVADAFNRAHAAAVTAAAAESKTQAGVRAVFLNIAHRSQVIVHKQLELLDGAEHEEQNPQRLDLLFQLDHLATRARRNAENLIIMGGEMPGRRWRAPVRLLDIVRGAVAESLEYKRIQISRLPELSIIGSSAADLIHLLAELTDNATEFSPPNTRVDITAQVVGRGIAIEVADQGLGMPVAEMADRNKTLATPPDFSVAALSSDARLGLFVVARLAARQQVTVRLSESDYGGIRAIVLVPSALVTDVGLDSATRLAPGKVTLTSHDA
ncbi:nitrate- and nitrite sensing domain-containing protein [Nocardia salmonicida]|uniref:sensor histidine kinase n=1 Tax=Nocardia salmonicida TaxID=53431 RepID=UPI002E2D0A62|nr:nitrate- and nitrite sensing domain-containing protein [Nocardia salmonicida]